LHSLQDANVNCFFSYILIVYYLRKLVINYKLLHYKIKNEILSEGYTAKRTTLRDTDCLKVLKFVFFLYIFILFLAMEYGLFIAVNDVKFIEMVRDHHVQLVCKLRDTNDKAKNIYGKI
jgi:hypothetical protein